MATTSTNLSLRKPESTDFVSVSLDISANFQTIDDKWATSAAANIGSAAAAGSALTVARTDHVHTVGSGTVGAPGLPIGESNSGFYRIGASNIGATIGGALAWAFSAAGIAIETALALKHVASVAATSGYVKIFAKSDENLYKHTGANDEVRILDADIFTAAGQIVYGTGAETFTQLALGTKGYALAAGASAPLYLPAELLENLVLNGEMIVDQQLNGTAYTSSTAFTNADDKYTLDNVNIISDGSDIASYQRDTTIADLPAGSQAALKIVTITANKKHGFVMFLTAAQSRKIIAGTASLSFKAKTTSAKVVNNIRCAVLSWSSTADSITSDVVSGTSWNAAGSDPTFATNWTAENTPANIALTTSWAETKIENIAIDTASAANVAVAFWTNDTDCAVGDEWYVTDVNLVAGATATPIRRVHPGAAHAACQWLLEVRAGANVAGIGFGSWPSTTEFDCVVIYSTKRVVPTVSATALAGLSVYSGGAAYSTPSTWASLQTTRTDAYMRATYGAPPGPAAGAVGNLGGNASAAYAVIDARL